MPFDLPEAHGIKSLYTDATYTVCVYKIWAPRHELVVEFRPANVSVKEHRNSVGPREFWRPSGKRRATPAGPGELADDDAVDVPGLPPDDPVDGGDVPGPGDASSDEGPHEPVESGEDVWEWSSTGSEV